MRRSVLGAATLISLTIVGLGGLLTWKLLSGPPPKPRASASAVPGERAPARRGDSAGSRANAPRGPARAPAQGADDPDDGDPDSPEAHARSSDGGDSPAPRVPASNAPPGTFLNPALPGGDPANPAGPGARAGSPLDPSRLGAGVDAGSACLPGMVDLGSFCIDAAEVTNTAYAAFLDAKPNRRAQPPTCSWNVEFTPAYGVPPLDTRPVVGVDWCDARAYCASAGKRLCGKMGGGPSPVGAYTESSRNEWFYVCTNGGATKFSYGDTFDPGKCADANGDGSLAPVSSVPTCVGTLAPYDTVFDMSGNAWEWEDSCAGAAGQPDLCRVRGGVTTGSSAVVSCSMDYLAKRESFFKTVGIRCCADRLHP